MIVAIVAAVLAGLAASPRSPLRAHERDTTPETITGSTPGRVLLFAHTDAQRRADLIVLVALQPGGRRASVVFVPAPTVVEVPSLDLAPLRDVTRIADRSLLATSIENALGIRIDDVVAVDDTGLARLFAPVRSVTVDFAEAVSVDDGHGMLTWPAGRVALSALDAQRVLVGREAAGTLSHLVTTQAVLAGWFAELARKPAAAVETRRTEPATAALVAAARATTRFDTLPVDAVDASSAERFDIRSADAAALVADDFGFARIALDGRRPRVEILNGVGEVGITPRAARLLVPAGADVRLTSNVPGFGVRTTTVVYYRDADEGAARALARTLGIGRVARGDTPLTIVDITVVVGRDFVARHPQ